MTKDINPALDPQISLDKIREEATANINRDE